MRGTFARTLADLAQSDPRILLLTGDLGYMALEPFAELHPDRFFNVGVAEQNLVGIGTGLAEAGFLPFLYSIATFAALRPYEFLRNGPVLQRLPVRLVGVGGGFEYGSAGPTHHGLEDVGVMRLQPGLTVLAPADAAQAEAALRATWELPGPVYYRLGKDDRAVVPELEGRFRLGRAEVLREGTDVAVLATGAIAGVAAEAVEELERAGVDAAFGVVASLAPAPLDDLAGVLERCPVAVTVEAHYVTGGLGSLVAELVAERAIPCRLVRCGVHGLLDGLAGSQRWLEARHGLSPAAIAEAALRELVRAPA